MTRAPTLADAIDRAVAAFEPGCARVEAEVLAMYACDLSRAEIVTAAGEALAPEQQRRYEALIERRRQGEPIAYIVGRREFWSLDFAVSPATLIPRPETELLVERALAHVPADRALSVVDLGTGCGAIGIAIAHARPRARLIATDCSAQALEIAQANARRLGVTNVEFLIGDWFAPLTGVRADIIVSNPPYVASGDPHLARGDARFEPPLALVGGADGLDAIRRIAAGAHSCLHPGGWLLLEHGWDQAARVRAELERHGYDSIAGWRDLAGRERVTECRR